MRDLPHMLRKQMATRIVILPSLVRLAHLRLARASLTVRFACDEVSNGTDGEQRLSAVLHKKFNPTKLEVLDISGGCGSMYNIIIESDAFRGHRIVQQHRMVTQALAEEIKAMHGLRISTSIPQTS